MSFLAADLGYASAFGGSQKPAPAAGLLAYDPLRLEIPSEYAKLQEVHKGQNGTLLIHIQDAHSNLSGQENLAQALDQILSRHKVDLVLVEGGSGNVSLTSIKDAAPADVWKKVAKSFLIEGKLSGEEYLNLASDHPMRIMGIEDEALYFESLRAYAELASHREATLEYLARVRRSVEKIKQKLYPVELIDYEKNNHSHFENKFEMLLKLAAPNGFPALEKLARIKEAERRIDFNLANLEQAALFEEITRRGGGGDLKERLEAARATRDNKLSQYAHFQSTLEIAQKSNVSLAKYPMLLQYGEYLKEFTLLDLEAVLEEMERFENGVYPTFLTTQDQRLIRAVDRHLALLQTAFQIRMTTKEFGEFKANDPDFGTIPYLAFVNRKLAELGYAQDMIAYENVVEEGKKALDAFYDSVTKRDFAFIENTEKILNGEKEKAAVLISGGYHTPHLKKLFREKGYSYAVLTPVVTSETIQSKYERLLLAPLKNVKGSSAAKNSSWKNSDGIRRWAAAQFTDGTIATRDELVLAASRFAKDRRPLQKAGARLAFNQNLDKAATSFTEAMQIVMRSPGLPQVLRLWIVDRLLGLQGGLEAVRDLLKGRYFDSPGLFPGEIVSRLDEIGRTAFTVSVAALTFPALAEISQTASGLSIVTDKRNEFINLLAEGINAVALARDFVAKERQALQSRFTSGARLAEQALSEDEREIARFNANELEDHIFGRNDLAADRLAALAAWDDAVPIYVYTDETANVLEVSTDGPTEEDEPNFSFPLLYHIKSGHLSASPAFPIPFSLRKGLLALHLAKGKAEWSRLDFDKLSRVFGETIRLYNENNTSGARLAKRDIIDLLNEGSGEGSTDEAVVTPGALFTMRLAEIFSEDPWVQRLEAADGRFLIQLMRSLERYAETDPAEPSSAGFLGYLAGGKDGTETLIHRIYGEIQARIGQDRADLVQNSFQSVVRHTEDWEWIRNFAQREWKLSADRANRLSIEEALQRLQTSKVSLNRAESRMANRILQDFVRPWAKRSYDHELDRRLREAGSLEGFLERVLEDDAEEQAQGARLASEAEGARPVDLRAVLNGSVDITESFIAWEAGLNEKIRSKQALTAEERAKFRQGLNGIRSKLKRDLSRYVDWSLYHLGRHITSAMERQVDQLFNLRKTQGGMASFPVAFVNEQGTLLNIPGLGDIFLRKIDEQLQGISFCDLGTRRYFLNVTSDWMRTELYEKVDRAVQAMIKEAVQIHAARRNIPADSDDALNYQRRLEELFLNPDPELQSNIPDQVYGSHGHAALKQTAPARDPLEGLSESRREQLEDGDFNVYSQAELETFDEELSYFEKELGHLPDSFDNFDRSRISNFRGALKKMLEAGKIRDFGSEIKTLANWPTEKKNLYHEAVDAYLMYRREILAHTATYYVGKASESLDAVVSPRTRKYLERRLQEKGITARHIAASYLILYWMDLYSKLYQRLEVVEPRKAEDEVFRDVVLKVSRASGKREQIAVLDDEAARYGMKEKLFALGAFYSAMYFGKLQEGALKATPLLDYYTARLPRPLSRLRIVEGVHGVRRKVADKDIGVFESLLSSADADIAYGLSILKTEFLKLMAVWYEIIFMTYHDPRLREIHQYGLIHEIAPAAVAAEDSRPDPISRFADHVDTVLRFSQLDARVRAELTSFQAILRKKAIIFRRLFGDEFGVLLPTARGGYRLLAIELKNANDFFRAYRPDRTDSSMNELLLEIEKIAQTYAAAGKTEDADIVEMAAEMRAAIHRMFGHLPFDVTVKAPINGEVPISRNDPAFKTGFIERQAAFVVPVDGRMPDHPNYLLNSSGKVLYRSSKKDPWKLTALNANQLSRLGAARFRDTIDLRANLWPSVIENGSILKNPRLLESIFYRQEVALSQQKKDGIVIGRFEETSRWDRPNVVDLVPPPAEAGPAPSSLDRGDSGARLAELSPEETAAATRLFPQIFERLIGISKSRKVPVADIAADPSEIEHVTGSLILQEEVLAALRERLAAWKFAVRLYFEKHSAKKAVEIYAGRDWTLRSAQTWSALVNAFVSEIGPILADSAKTLERREELAARIPAATEEEIEELYRLFERDNPAWAAAVLCLYYGRHGDLERSKRFYVQALSHDTSREVFNNAFIDFVGFVFDERRARPLELSRKDPAVAYFAEHPGLPSLELELSKLMPTVKNISEYLNGLQNDAALAEWAYAYEKAELSALKQALAEEGFHARTKEMLRRVTLRRLLTHEIVNMDMAEKDEKLFRQIEAVLSNTAQNALSRLRNDYFVRGLVETFTLEQLKETLRTVETVPMRPLDDDDMAGRLEVIERLEPLLSVLRTTHEAMSLAAFIESRGRSPQAIEILKAAIAIKDGEEAARKILLDKRSGSLRTAFDALPEWVRENHDHTAFYAAIAGQMTGLDAASLRDLYVAAFLHDTGKINVPEEILGKRAGLTPEERAVMEGHVTHSLNIIGAVPDEVFTDAGVSKANILTTIEAYHEEPDGSGYPKHLRSAQIPVGSSILHVADSVDAMLAVRPYQPVPQPLTSVLGQLRASAGDPDHAKFEPRIAQIFLDILSPRQTAVRPGPERRGKGEAPAGARLAHQNPSIGTHQGRKDVQEDAAFAGRITVKDLPNGSGLLIAVFDGHSGIKNSRHGGMMAERAADQLKRIFRQALSDKTGSVDAAMLETMRNLDLDLEKQFPHMEGGTTAAIAYVPDPDANGASKVTAASLGDSFIYLRDASGMNVGMPVLNASVVSERANVMRRARELGKTVLEDERGVYLQYGDFLFQSTRSLGDFEFPFLDRTPVIRTFEVKQGVSSIVLATDGVRERHIIEALSNDETAQDLVERSRGSDNRTAVIWRAGARLAAGRKLTAEERFTAQFGPEAAREIFEFVAGKSDLSMITSYTDRRVRTVPGEGVSSVTEQHEISVAGPIFVFYVEKLVRNKFSAARAKKAREALHSRSLHLVDDFGDGFFETKEVAVNGQKVLVSRAADERRRPTPTVEQVTGELVGVMEKEISSRINEGPFSVESKISEELRPRFRRIIDERSSSPVFVREFKTAFTDLSLKLGQKSTPHNAKTVSVLSEFAREMLRYAESAPKDREGARLAQKFVDTAEAAESVDPETLVLIARALLDLKKIKNTLPFEFKLGNALITAELSGNTGWVYFYNKGPDGKRTGKYFAKVALTEKIVDEARKLKDSQNALRVKLAERSDALEAFADDQSSVQKARQFYNQLKKDKAPDVEFDNDRTAVLRFTTEKKLRPEKLELYRKQLQTIHSVAGKKVLIQFAQIRRNGKILFYGPSDPTPARGEDFALFHLSELSEKALKAAQGEEAGFVSVPGLSDDETVIPFVAQGVFLAALGRLSGYTDSIQQLWRNVRGADAVRDLDPASFADIRKVLTVDLGRYSKLQLRTIARIAWEKVLEYTRLAIQAVGSAA